MLIYFILYLFIEVMVSSYIAGQIGGFLTFVELIASFAIGLIILKNFQLSLMDSINQVRNGQLTQEEFLQTNIGKMIGAVMLMIPGFFTDIIGLLLQFSVFVILFSKMLTFRKVQAKQDSNYSANNTTFTYTTYNKTYNKKGENDEIIDVEVIDDYKSIRN